MTGSTATDDRTNSVLLDVHAERGEQRKRWGGAEHDDGHGHAEWTAYITKHLGRSVEASEHGNLHACRKALVRVAALAVAAIETIDRAHGRPAAVLDETQARDTTLMAVRVAGPMRRLHEALTALPPSAERDTAAAAYAEASLALMLGSVTAEKP